MTPIRDGVRRRRSRSRDLQSRGDLRRSTDCFRPELPLSYPVQATSERLYLEQAQDHKHKAR